MSGVVRLFPEAPGAALAGEAMRDALRIAEALLFAATEPMAETEISRRLPRDVAVAQVMAQLQRDYASRGIRLVRLGSKWVFRTAEDLGWLFASDGREIRKLSRAAMETLAIIAYHQPATRADIEGIRGVSVAKGTLDTLLEAGWVRPRARRRAPGRPITYGTTDQFLLQFGLESIGDLPGLDELRAIGVLDARLPPGFTMPLPRDGALSDDEEPFGTDEDDAVEPLDSADDNPDVGTGDTGR